MQQMERYRCFDVTLWKSPMPKAVRDPCLLSRQATCIARYACQKTRGWMLETNFQSFWLGTIRGWPRASSWAARKTKANSQHFRKYILGHTGRRSRAYHGTRCRLLTSGIEPWMGRRSCPKLHSSSWTRDLRSQKHVQSEHHPICLHWHGERRSHVGGGHAENDRDVSRGQVHRRIPDVVNTGLTLHPANRLMSSRWLASIRDTTRPYVFHNMPRLGTIVGRTSSLWGSKQECRLRNIMALLGAFRVGYPEGFRCEQELWVPCAAYDAIRCLLNWC